MKYTKRIVDLILAAIGNGATYKAACGYAGITEETFYRWMKEKAEFCESVKRTEIKAQGDDEIRLSRIIGDEEHRYSFQALIFRLKTRWGFKENVGVTGALELKGNITTGSSDAQKAWDKLDPESKKRVREEVLEADRSNRENESDGPG